MSKGFFVCLEGPDGSGKTTLCEGLSKRLKAQGLSVVHVAEPGTTDLGLLVRAYTKTHGAKTSPETLFMLFSAARSQLIDEVILPALESGKIIICDRFIPSTIAMQACLLASQARETSSDSLSFINSVFKHSVKGHENSDQNIDRALGIIPDITFFIKRKSTDIVKTIDSRDTPQEDFFESCPESMRAVRAEYNKLMNSKTRSYMSFTYTKKKIIIENDSITQAVEKMSENILQEFK